MKDMRFCWVSDRPLPKEWDLRAVGWQKVAIHEADERTVCLHDWSMREKRARIVSEPSLTAVMGVDRSAERAQIVADGVGEALPSATDLGELAWRLVRMVQQAERVECFRQAGPITLDLLQRDGTLAGRRMSLEPAVFALLWTLCSGVPGPKSAKAVRAAMHPLVRLEEEEFARTVRRAQHRLALSGLGWLIATSPDGLIAMGRKAPASFSAFSEARHRAPVTMLDSAPPIAHQAAVLRMA